MKQPVTFNSEGCKLTGDLYLPEGLRPKERRAGVVLCHGYTGVKDLYLPDNARVLNEAGYAVLTFDYKGWGASEGPRSRLAPYSRVADVQAALTFLGLQPNVDPERLGLTGRAMAAPRSFGSARSIRASDASLALSALGMGGAGCAACAGRTSGMISWIAPRPTARSACSMANQPWPIGRRFLLPDRQSAELAAAARRANPAAVNELPLEFIDDTLGFHPEWVVDKIAPRPICSSRPTTTGWSHQRNPNSSSPRRANPRNW